MILANFFRKKTEKEKTQKEKESYYGIIDKCAEKKEDFTIRNNADEHAVYVLKTLFMHAQNGVCIFIHGFNETIFNDHDLIMEAINFLKKPEARLRIAYNDITLNKEAIFIGEFIRSILNPETKGKVEIWDASKICFPNGNHFFLNDRFGFRYEIEPRNAVANFGDKINGQKLFVIFANIVAKSDKILG